MQIVTVQFDREGNDNYKRLLDVFRDSVKRHMPEATFVELTVPVVPEKVEGKVYAMSANTAKLDVWCEYMESCKEEVIFADCDMVLLKDASHAFDEPFDIAYTLRTGSVMRINAGIIMARPTEKARGFFRKWRDVNRFMYEENGKFYHEWRAKIAGMNQAALGYMVSTKDYDADIHVYRTREWNAVECDWAKINDDTVFLHVKGKMQELVLNHKNPYPPNHPAMEAWYREAGVEVVKYEGYGGYGCNHRIAKLKRMMANKELHKRKLEREKAEAQEVSGDRA